MDLALATAVAPATMAAERTLPVLPALTALLPEGLVRGRTVACDGLTAPALGLTLAVQACREGAWLAVVDLPWLGVEATVEAGVPVERVVRVDTRRSVGVSPFPGKSLRRKWITFQCSSLISTPIWAASTAPRSSVHSSYSVMNPSSLTWIS